MKQRTKESIAISPAMAPGMKPYRRRWFRGTVISLLILVLIFIADTWWHYHGPCAPARIYPGIIYSCERLPDTPESGGLLHLICGDLSIPGVSLYVTPLDPFAVAHDWQYRLRYVSSIVRDEHLAAAVNGTLYSSDSGWIRLSGDYGRAVETVVADHVVSHIHPHTYLLWWDDDLIAHLERTKPPSIEVLKKAQWAIGGQAPVLYDGEVHTNEAAADHRTMIAADPDKKLVWLAVFDRASYRFAAQSLAAKGAKIGVMVDGGTSSSMAIGNDATGVRPGAITGNWRPVANVFGLRFTPRL